MKRFWDIPLEFVVIGVNVLTFFLVLILQSTVGLPEGAESLAFAITIPITIMVVFLKEFIADTFAEHIRIYELLSDIKDRDLRLIGVRYMDDARQKLYDLSQSTVTGSDESFLLLSRKLEKARDTVFVTNIAYSLDDLRSWKTQARARDYYRTNLSAMSRDVTIKRIFLLDKTAFWNDNDNDGKGDLHPEARKIIEKHYTDGVDVYVVWHQEIQNHSEIEDFVIIDYRLVYVSGVATVLHEDDWSGEIFYDDSAVERYQKRWRKFERIAEDFTFNKLTVEEMEEQQSEEVTSRIEAVQEKRRSFLEQIRRMPLWAIAIPVNMMPVIFVLLLRAGSEPMPAGSEFLAFTITATITLLILSLERFANNIFETHIQLYELLSKIDDEDLRVIGKEYMGNADRKLSDLTRETVNGSDESFLFLSRKLEQATGVVFATCIAYSQADLESWRTQARARNYYITNIAAIRRDVVIKRLFLLKKSVFWDDRTNDLTPAARDIIEQHHTDGIDVHVVWHEDIENQAEIEDFVIVDGWMVYVSRVETVLLEDDWSGRFHDKRDTVLRYNNRWKKFRRLSEDLTFESSRHDIMIQSNGLPGSSTQKKLTDTG